MTRDEICLQIGYSIRLEKMQSMLLARLERASSFLMIVLGTGIAIHVLPVVTAAAVAVLAAFSFVYQPGTKSVLASMQKQKYENLRARINDLSDAELLQCFAKLQESDSQAFGSLRDPAHMAEQIRLGIEPDFKLTWLQKVMAFMAGDLPRP